MSAMEGTESAWVTGSGMSAITGTILQLCSFGDHIVSSQTIYGGTFAFLQNYLPKFNISVSFVDITDLKAVEKAIKPNTKLIYTETMTNPMLQISDIPSLSAIAHKKKTKLIVDNTFTPMLVSPCLLGADIVVHSMTKFINGKNDCVAGAICGSKEFIDSLCDVNNGTAMLLGPVLDPLRSSSILKNLHTLHIRMEQHSKNAQYLAEQFKKRGIPVSYPGLPEHSGHEVLKKILNPGFGYLAVSLGYFKTLFSNSGKSTSSEVPEDIQKEMGMSPGLVRFSVGLDNDIKRTWKIIEECLSALEN
jgi:methionine-gamma-lyase